MRPLIIAFALSALGGCTWVKLDDAGQNVRVAYNGNVAGCREVGEVSVSVKDKVGFYERNDLKVRDELESLARNEAVTLKADTIRALDEPHDGEQRYSAFVCGKKGPGPEVKKAYREDEKRSDAVETYPIKDH